MRLILTCAAAWSLAAAATAAEGETVLGKGDYWRCFYAFGREESEAGKPYTAFWNRGLASEGVLKPTAPPADWMKPEFDDSGWALLRGGLETGACHILRQAYFRGFFEVADPAAAVGLRLTVAVRGGAVAYVNGEEVARAALPAGPVTVASWADGYPLEAYGVKQADGRMKWYGDYDYGVPYTDGVGHVYGATGIGEKNLMLWGQGGTRGSAGIPRLNKEDWEKLGSLRNRKIEVEVPAKLLRRGRNVVAFALCGSKTKMLPGRNQEAGDYPYGEVMFPHAQFLDARLTSATPGAAAASRGKGLQVWAADIHQRLFNFDYSPYGAPPAQVNLIGARNGVFSGQIAVRSDTPTAGLAVSASDLTGPGGAKIPASVVQVRYGVGSPASLLVGGFGIYGAKLPAALQHCLDIHSRELVGLPEKEQLGKLLFFDRLAARPPVEVPANTCQPIWVTVRVPRDAAAGDYQGTVTIKTGGGDAAVPVKLSVAGWALPEPKAFASMVDVEQSPWGMLEHYKNVKPWSDEHWKLMERSFRMLAELGSEVLVIPVQAPSEFGNRADAMVLWVKKDGGGYDYDFTRLDRYLELASKCLGRLTVVEFVVADPYPHNQKQHGASVLDRASGKQERLQVSPLTEEGAGLWVACARAIYAHMKEKGLADRVYWGHIEDFPIENTKKPFNEAIPEVGWVRSCHHVPPGGKDRVKFGQTIMVLPALPKHKETGRWSLMGWKNPVLHVVFPRVENSVITVDTYSEPYAFRLLPEKSVVHGGRGAGRMGFDFWGNYAGGWAQGGNNSTMNMHDLSWPGPDGAEGTVRFEIFREGLQETEARIALEKLLDGGLGKAPEGGRVWDLLDARILETAFVTSSGSSPLAQYCTGWRERSRLLYDAAAKVANAK